MHDVHFREARRDDIGAIVALIADDALGAAREDTGEPLARAYLDAFDAIDADRHHELIVGELDGAVVATLQLSFIPNISHRGAWRAHIEAVHVAASLRRTGIGTRLMRWAIDRARHSGCRLVQLTSNKRRRDAARFYERLGFRATHEGMKLSLDDPDTAEESDR